MWKTLHTGLFVYHVCMWYAPQQAYGELLVHLTAGKTEAQKLTHTGLTARRDSNLTPNLWMLLASAPPGKWALAHHRWEPKVQMSREHMLPLVFLQRSCL